MRKLFTYVIFVCGALSSYAGDVVYEAPLSTEEEFGQWLVVDANEDATTWGFDSYNEAAKYGYNMELAADDWLISPAIELEAGSYILSFEYQGSTYGEKMDVFFGTSRDAASMTQPVIDLGDIYIDGSFAPASGLINVTASGNIYLGFHAKSDANKYKLFVRNVKLETAQGYDICVDSVRTTPSGENLGQEPVKLYLRNTGFHPVSNLQVSYQIDQQPAVTETITGTIGAGESYLYTFEAKADLSESGSYTIKAWSNLENDDIANNDTSTVSVRHFGPAKVPYFNGFEDEYSREAIKYFDLNFDEADGGNGCWAINVNSWFSSFSRTGDYSMVYWYSSNNVGDDWFILEPIQLKAGYYSLKFWYSSFSYDEKFAVYYGTEATPEAMTTKVVEYAPFNTNEYMESANVIHIETDGIYYFGFHAFSDANKNVICIDDISLEEIDMAGNDLAIKELTSPVNEYVTPQQSQDISFSVINNSVNAISGASVEVAIDGAVVETFNIETVGAQETKSYVCEQALANLEVGKHSLKITIVNEGDESPENNILESDFKVVKNPVMYYDFETGTIPEELILRAEDGATVNSSLNDIFPNNEAWNLSEINEHPVFGSWMLTAASWFTTVTPADRWCIFPQIGVTSDNADMVWSAMSGDAGEEYAEDYEIMVSTTDAEPESFTSVKTITDENFATNPSTRGIDLGAYKGQNIYVAIRLTTTDGYMLSIDNIGFYGDLVKGGSGVESAVADGRLWMSEGQVVCSAEQVDRIVVFDASGRQVAACENQSTLDVNDLSSGVYLVRALADGQVLQTKFVK